ncbi:MAG: hypothetical protein HUJ30_02420 [Gammaproteobacteria bacterium]|nr:hypothetical protein [Gammaproteobacteria bacterium]
MAQVTGADAKFVLYEEDIFGQDPSVPDGILMHLSGMSIKGTRGQTASKILPGGTGNRTQKRPTRNKLEVGGGMPTELNAQTLGFLVKHAMGAVATYRPADNATDLITGVTIDHATKACPLGNGTLAFTLTGTTLQWTAQGDTAGTATDVSAGGTFVLPSGTAGYDLTVTVVPGSLPGANQSDTINVIAAYKNRFTFAKLPIGFTMEKDHGPEITGAGRYVRYNGCRINTMSFKLTTDGTEVSVDVLGAKKAPYASALDATPTDYGHTSFEVGDISVLEENGTPLAEGADMSITINNSLDGGQYVLLGGGTRRSIPEGDAGVEVQYSALFEDLDLYNKMINGTDSKLKAAYAVGNGLGTVDNESIVFTLDPISYEEDDTAIEGPGGVVINPKAMAYDGALIIDIFNTIDHSL